MGFPVRPPRRPSAIVAATHGSFSETRNPRRPGQRGPGDGVPMSVELERRRVLIAAAPGELGPLLELFARGLVEGGEALGECRRQVRRLVTLLWAQSPTESHPRWFTQRHMMERLHEEIARTQRHGSPLAVVLGEVRAGDDSLLRADAPHVAAWTAER